MKRLLVAVQLVHIKNASSSNTRRYLRQRADDTAHKLTFARSDHYMWSGGFCTTDNDCHTKLRTRAPSSTSTASIGSSLCGCYATSITSPLDECQGEYEKECAMAACFVNSCFNFEAYCSSDKGICELRYTEEAIFPRAELMTELKASPEVNDTMNLKHEGQAVVFTPEESQDIEKSRSDEALDQTSDDPDNFLNLEHNGYPVVFAIEAKDEEEATDEAEETIIMANFEWIDPDPSENKPAVDLFAEDDADDDGHTDFSWITLKEDAKGFDDFESSMSMDKVISVDYSWIEKVDESEKDMNNVSKVLWIRATGKSSKSTKSPTSSGKSTKKSSSPTSYSGKSSKTSPYSGKSAKSLVNVQTEVHNPFTYDKHTDDGTDFSWVTEDDAESLVDVETSLSMIAAVGIPLPMSLSMGTNVDYDTNFTWIELV